MTDPVTLTYAPPPRRALRSRFLKYLFFVAILVAGLWYSPRILRWTNYRIEVLSLVRTCRTFSPRADAVVYDDTDNAEKMVELPPYDQLMSHIWRDADSVARLAYRRETSAFGRLRAVVGNPDSLHLATLFLHERTTHSGDQLVVGVVLHANRSTDHYSAPSGAIRFEAYAVRPMGWFTPSSPESTTSQGYIAPWPRGGRRVRFYAGQPDPTDASRFTIAYQLGDQPGIIDGVLNNDLTVTLTPRTGPLAKAAQ